MTTLENIYDPNFQSFLRGIIGDRTYQLPGNPQTDEYLMGCSGGADSSVLAMVMCALFPHINFRFIFTDTKAEEPEIYTTIDKLEAFIGRKIERTIPKDGLFELVDVNSGFLPSGQARWCTRLLKLVPFENWMKQFAGKHKVVLVGIRADETERVAFTIHDCETEMPFIDLGIMREDVFRLMAETIGIPRYYEHRTRSGCSVCFFQRRSEVIGLMQYQPIEFHRGKRYEKLSVTDSQNHIPAVPLWKDSSIADNWLGLPLPMNDGDMEGRRPREHTVSLFGTTGIFVAAEFFFDGMYNSHEFIWKQRVVSFSPSLAGIKRQIDDRFRHLLATSEVHQMSNDDIRNNVRFGIYYIEEDTTTFFPKRSDETYSWKSDNSFAQIEHIVSKVTRSLKAANLLQIAQSNPRPDTVQEEWKLNAIEALKKLSEPVGTVANSCWYTPKDEMPDLSDEELLKTIPCPMCSI